MPAILNLQNVSKQFGGVPAVDDFTYDFEGGMTALIGPNGAGKTTAFNLIGGHLHPDTGTVTFEGQRLSGCNMSFLDRKPWNIASLGIGRLFQDVRLFKKMTVLENVMTAFPKQRGESIWRILLAPWTEIKPEQERRQHAMELLERVGLADKADALADNLSYGEQKLVALARLLAAEAKLLLLDEPAAGVNPAMIPKLLETIKGLATPNRTIIFIEHNLDIVRNLAEQVVFMAAGAKIMSGSPQEVLANPKVRTAYTGTMK